MSIKLTIKDEDTDLEDSKFFGDALFPESWLEDDIFSPDEMFFCQINLTELYESVGKTVLPESGLIYFFIDYGKKTTAKVRYFDGEADAYTAFNEDYECDYDVFTDWKIEFSSGGGDGTALLATDENVEPGSIALLRYCPKDSPLDFMSESGLNIYFIITSDDLKNRRFENAVIKFVKTD